MTGPLLRPKACKELEKNGFPTECKPKSASSCPEPRIYYESFDAENPCCPKVVIKSL